MKRSTVRKVEDILRDYPKIDKYIERREEELRYPTTPDDENVGGGRATMTRNEAPLRAIITIDEDRRIHALKRQREIVDDCLDGVGHDTETIIGELYFKRHPRYTLTGLVENNLVGVGKARAYELRNDFIRECAKNLGLYDL
ncbi:MAG TPA: transcriptional regulator [Candidatus Levilactobacillus faecigallinarum]|uniref:Transcriptional regulator n=1 Tax=Candidatus Levilactobacillus faecigallinarum TaxID=2838638 RepID=A0A9D1U6B9_9LACO|nr:transcriptional regulator [Candidatus Levilactobacillus faecigallinarum]